MKERFLRRARWDEERARELDAYLAQETDDNIARGMTPDEARYAARRKLGNATRIREEIYEMNTMRVVDALWHDLKFGARLLRRSPGFAAVAIMSLALGIGANAAIFQLLDAVRLRTLPVADPQRLADVHIADMNGARGSFSVPRPAVTNRIWEAFRDRQQAFSGVLAWGEDTFNLSPGGEVRPAHALWVSGGFFDVLGVRARLGRVFGPADDRRGCGSPGVVLSAAFWQREYGGDPAIVTRTLTLLGHPLEIVGVTEAGFFGLEPGRSFDVALPLCADATFRGANSRLDAGTTWFLTVLGRLKPGWTFEEADAHLRSISPQIFKATLPAGYPPVSVPQYLGFDLAALPGGTGVSRLREIYSTPLWVLLAVAGIVLLVACANLANLMLARATSREREVAVRLALGASRGRVVRQLLAESALIAALGAAAGAVVARAISLYLVAFISERANPWVLDLSPDGRVLGFMAAIGVGTCLLFGLSPALRAMRTNPGVCLKGARGAGDGGGRLVFRHALVVAQVALSLVLLVGALLFTQTLRNLLTVDTGFDERGVLIASVDFTRLKMPEGGRQAFIDRMQERVRAVPGVEATADTAIVPISGDARGNDVWSDASGARHVNALMNAVGSGYFRAIASPLVAGREFDARDTAAAPKVAVVNEAFAAAVVGADDPIGRRFFVEKTPFEPETAYTIVGVARNAKYLDLREAFRPTAFFAIAQDRARGQSATLLMRSRLPLATLTASVKSALADVDPRMSVVLDTLESRIASSVLTERLMATLSGFFAALAAVLATIGLYGVMSYTVARRRGEIGVRMALGATRGDVLKLVAGGAARLVAIGLAIGVALALAVTRAADALLFGLRPYDPATLATSVTVLAAVAAIAGYIPAARAARLDPMVALREE